MRFIRSVIISAIPIFLAGAISPLAAHGGGLDRCVGHNDRKNGGYHVHNQAQYCACHPDGSGCGGRTPPAPAPTPRPAAPTSAQGLAAVPSEATATATVYVTASGTKYHREGCQYLTATARATTLAEAAKSKTPCSVCKPATMNSPALGAVPSPPNSPTGTAARPPPAIVTRVVDGDTLVVAIDGREERVRLIGVDTPETVHRQKPVEYCGKEASAFTKRMVEGKTVVLQPDRECANRDKYGRLLRYVWLDKDTLLNLEIIAQGYGFAYVKYPFSQNGGVPAAGAGGAGGRAGTVGRSMSPRFGGRRNERGGRQ